MSTLTLVLVSAATAVAAALWFARRRSSWVPCRVDLERTHEHLHAHVELEGIEVGAGDTVLVLGLPSTAVAYGERRRVEASALVEHASWLRRQWTRLVGRLEFYELYDVGFE